MKSKPDPAATLAAYRDLIPATVRNDILDHLLRARLRGFEDFVDATTYVMAHVLVGNVPPEVADSLKGYFELLFTAVSAQQLTGGKGKVTADAVERARAASRPRIEPRVHLEQTSEGLKVVDLALVTVDQERKQ